MATQTEAVAVPETLDQHEMSILSRLPMASSATIPVDPHGHAIVNQSEEAPTQRLTKKRTWIIVSQLAGINFVTSFSNGLLVIALPAIARDLDLPASLLLWPNSVYALTCGSCLLIAGSVADVIGARSVNLTGCFFNALFTLLNGFSQTGIQLVMFRAMQGIASALAFPSAMSIVSRSVESGKPRNIGFASLGLAMPLGFLAGLTLGGVFVSSVGWRAGYWFGAGVSFLLFAIGLVTLPKGIKPPVTASIRRRLVNGVDWIGAIMASSSIALLSYVLAMLSADVSNIKRPGSIVSLILSLTFLPSFVYWVARQERLGKPALIPNSLWKKLPFTAISLMVLLSYGVCNGIELYSSLFFQEVQDLTALDASIRILPAMVVGIALNFITGWFVNKIPAIYAVLISSGLCTLSPLLMAVINPRWPYWYDAFFAQVLSPLSVDVLFCVGLLVISDVFPPETQALAGAVFNTLAQVGTSLGFTITSVVSVTVTKDSDLVNKSSPRALMEGYRAAFWTLFAWMVAACLIGSFGLRNLGKVGVKRD